MALNKRQYVDGQTIVTASNLNEIQDCIITIEGSYVPKTRKVAGKALSSDITISAGDVGAVPTSRTINAKALTGNITLSAADVGAVPVARTVNGKALSSNITLSAADVSAVPTTRTVNSKALSQNISLTASDVGAVPVARTVNGKALSSNITLASGDIGDDSDAGGATVKASLSLLKGSLTSLGSDDIANTSQKVSGSKVTNALDSLYDFTHDVSTAKIATIDTTNIQSGTVTSIKSGNLVQISGQIKAASSGVGAWLQTLCTLSSDAKADNARSVWAYANYNNNWDMVLLELLADGTLRTRISSGAGNQIVGNSWITIPNQIIFV